MKDIFYIGDDFYYKNNLKLFNIKNGYNFNSVKNLEDINKKSGFLFIITMDELYEYFPEFANIYSPDVYEIDRNIRRMFSGFKYVIIISIEEFDYGNIPFSNIYVEYANKYFESDNGIHLLIDKLKDESLNEMKISNIKKNNINKLMDYISGKDYILTKDIIKDLNVNGKWIQRYMKDMNSLYNNIGYNKKKKVWYTVK